MTLFIRRYCISCLSNNSDEHFLMKFETNFTEISVNNDKNIFIKLFLIFWVLCHVLTFKTDFISVNEINVLIIFTVKNKDIVKNRKKTMD